MRFQSHAASCGPAALRNALLARGIERSEDELGQLSGCTTNGTAARGLLKAVHLIAVEHPQIRPGIIREKRGDIALLKLHAAHRAGVVGILCVDRFEHWVTSFGLLGEGVFHVADSGDNELIKHYSPDELIERWAPPGKHPFYAILV